MYDFSGDPSLPPGCRDTDDGVGENECPRCGGTLDDRGYCDDWWCPKFWYDQEECKCPECKGEGCQYCDGDGSYAIYLRNCERDGVNASKFFLA